jgi:hypothetical protein
MAFAIWCTGRGHNPRPFRRTARGNEASTSPSGELRDELGGLARDARAADQVTGIPRSKPRVARQLGNHWS